jgi:putative nucleotidyltransferase with HDIG domain
MFQAPATHFDPDAGGTTCLSEIMSAFSYALDLTEGQPEGHSLRCCWLAGQMALALGLPPAERRTVHYATMLKDLGCSSNAARIAEVYQTDDRSFKHDYKLVGDGLGPTLGFVFTRTASKQGLAARARAIAAILRDGPAIAHELIQARCTRGADIARQLRFPETVASAIAALDEHWDGGGKPLGLRGEAIPLAARLALLTQIADVFHSTAGPEAACAELRARRGTWFDPALVDCFLTLARAPDFWHALDDPRLEQRLALLEPDEWQVPVDEDYLDAIAEAFGTVIDAKSPYTGGHSCRVGRLAQAMGQTLGLAADDVRNLRRAALLHDVGKLAVSSRILEKPGKLDDDEWQVMRSHADHTMQILGRIGPLRFMAGIAGAHHERLDGRGYPLGLDAALILRESRIITVCDFYDALTADRPYRAAMPVEQALEIMRGEAGTAIDRDCLDVLEALVMG